MSPCKITSSGTVVPVTVESIWAGLVGAIVVAMMAEVVAALASSVFVAKAGVVLVAAGAGVVSASANEVASGEVVEAVVSKAPSGNPVVVASCVARGAVKVVV
jgi:hypothetical protein